MLRIVTTREGDTSLLRLAGTLDRGAVKLLCAEIENSPPGEAVALDLADLHYVDRDGLAFLLRCRRRMRLTNIPAFVDALLDARARGRRE